jgi:hypothetical protein
MLFRFLRRPACLLFVFPVFIIMLAGCATSSKTIAIDLTDTSEVTGTWKGRFEPSRNPRAGSILTLRLKPDGKYVYGIFNGKYEGTYRIEKGKLVLYPKTSGRTTIITYYDRFDAGNRKVLKWKSQRGNFTLSRVK